MNTNCKTRTFFTTGFFRGRLLLLFFLIIFPVTVFAAPAADPQASSKTQGVLDYLTNLPNRSDNRVVSGQHTQMWDNLIQNIYASTGKYPGLVGVDYFYENNSSTNNQIIAWSNANSLVTIMHHWNNPVTGSMSSPNQGTGAGTAWDTTNVDFTQLTTSGTALNTKFIGYLDAVATGLQTLQNNNVVVLYRPFHEMNGTWFWWGAKDPTQFKNVWKYVFNYLTQTKGLHNLLWVYSPNASYDMTAYYPGPGYVDIVGMDIYGGVSLTDTTDYNTLLTLNKPFAITEYGPCSPSGCSSAVDISQMITSIKANMPKAAFWMQWSDSFSMYYNSGATKLLADPWVITRDEILLSGTGTQPPPPPAGLVVVSTK